MIFKCFILPIIFFCTCSNMAICEVIKIKDFALLRDYFKTIEKNTLVIFDIDDVILMPTDEFNMDTEIRKKLTNVLKQKYTKEERRLLYSIVLSKRKVKLVDSKIKMLFEDLTKMRIPVTALTSWWTGSYGKIANMESIRFSDLKQVDISFKNISPFTKDTKLKGFKADKGIPMIKHGIILTATHDKGKVLKQSLELFGLSYKNIILVDDQLINIKSVEKICQQTKINFTGLHYTFVQQMPPIIHDMEKEKLRYEVLKKEHIWLTNNEFQERFPL